MSNTYFSSDSHWHHQNILRYCNRDFSSIEEMNEALIQNWNRMVKPNDKIYHLGDFAFCSDEKLFKLLRRLNGQKHIILGNHDKVIKKNAKELLEKKLFHSIQEYYELKHHEHFIVLFHYPMRSWNKSYHGSYHLYGHVHNRMAPYGRSLDVGVDCTQITTEYRPYSLDEIIEFMKNRELIQE